MCIDCFCNKTSVLKSFLQLSRLSGSFPGIPNFPGYPEIFWIIRKICSLSGNVSGYPETFQIIRKISSLSGKYPAYLENIQPIQKISSLSGNFPAYPETFQAIRKLSRLSRNFPDHPENIQPIRKISRQSGKNPDYLEIFQRVRKLLSAILRVTRKNFPDAQKLSGWQCHPATQVFGTLAPAPGPLKCFCAPRHQIWPKVPSKKRVIATKLKLCKLSKDCVNVNNEE